MKSSKILTRATGLTKEQKSGDNQQDQCEAQFGHDFGVIRYFRKKTKTNYKVKLTGFS